MNFKEKLQSATIGEFKRFNYDPVEFSDMNAEMRDGKRFYVTPTGTAYPSITTVLSHLSADAIKKWRKRVGEDEANKVSTKASSRGTRVHTICENYLAGDVDKLKGLAYTDLATFKTIKPILDQYVDNIKVQEAALYSDFLQVAGRTDLIADYRGKLSIIDFKTSLKTKKKEWITSYFLQGAAYCVCFEEMTKIPVSQIVIIIAVDNNDSQVFIEKRDDHIQGFINARNTFREMHGV